jgi:phosphoglycerate dehydrogenase-like enzyme
VWSRALPTAELDRKTVRIIGVGAIGGQIAKFCHAFNMKVLGVNRSGNHARYVDEMGTMEELKGYLTQADFVVSVLPSTIETKYVLSKEHFRLMKDTAVFINIGRGDVARESILIEVLNEGQIAHAVLDVFEQEPLPSNHVFWGMENVTVTPHISSITSNYLPRAFEIFEENLHIYKSKGTKYINQIDVGRGY